MTKRARISLQDLVAKLVVLPLQTLQFFGATLIFLGWVAKVLLSFINTQ